MNKNLYTKRLVLQPLSLSDMNSIFHIAKERKSIEDFQYVANNVGDVRAWLETSFHDPKSVVWVIRKQGKVVGLFDVYFEAEYSGLDTNICRIGYFLDFREHNKGLMTEALVAVINWLFLSKDVERIEAGVTLHNLPSYRILEKVGFIRDKVVKGNWNWRGKSYDSAYYYLLKENES